MKKTFKMETFTKKWLSRILVIALIDMQLTYVLAFLGHENIAETLSVCIAGEIVGVMLGYFAKSFFETKEEKRLDFDKAIYDIADNDIITEEGDRYGN